MGLSSKGDGQYRRAAVKRATGPQARCAYLDIKADQITAARREP